MAPGSARARAACYRFSDVKHLRALTLASSVLVASSTASIGYAQSAPWNNTGSSPWTTDAGDAGDAANVGDAAAIAPTPAPTAVPTSPTPAAPQPAPTPGATLTLTPTGTAVPPAGLAAAAMDPRQIARARRAALTAARLHLLNSMMVPSLATRGRASRIQSGITSAVIGTGLGILGYFAPSSPYDMRPWFYAQAAVAMVNAGIDLIWTPSREILPGQYNAMPMRTARERRARVRFGEQALDSMASDAVRRRLTTGLVRIAASLAMLVIVYRDPLFNGQPFNPGPFDFLIIGFTGVDVVTNLITAFSTAEEERLPRIYHERVEQIRAEQDAMFGTPEDTAAPATSATPAEVPPPAVGTTP